MRGSTLGRKVEFYRDMYSSDLLSALNASIAPRFLSERPLAIPPRSPDAQKYAESTRGHRQVQRVDVAPFALEAESRYHCGETTAFRGLVCVEVAAECNRKEVSAE